MGIRMARFSIAATAVSFVLAGCDPAPNPGSTSGTTPPPTQPATSPAPSASGRAPSQALIDAVRRHGTVRVIVTLAIAYTPEGKLSGPDDVRRQRAEIASAQQRLIEELKPVHAKVNTQYERTPQLALEVDEAALRRLFASQLVASVQQDTPD